MNLLSPAITETDEGDILIVWGGRRIVTRVYDPPMIDSQFDEEMGIPVEHRWVRRYRWDSGPLVITRIYDGGKKRKDYNAIVFGRNPAIVKDDTGRIWIGYHIPIISTQDPFGALYRDYVNVENVGTTAGMNFWQMVRVDDVSKFRASYPWSWSEQVSLTLPPKVPTGDVLPSVAEMDAGELADYLMEHSGDYTGVFDEFADDGDGWNMFSSFTYDRISGRLMFRGQGANEMDAKNPTHWLWNAEDGLGRTYNSCVLDSSGRQVRLRGRAIEVSLNTDWKKGSISRRATFGNCGLSGNLCIDRQMHSWIAYYNSVLGEIPYQVENEVSIQTYDPNPGVEPSADNISAHRLWKKKTDEFSAWQLKQDDYSYRWSLDNERDYVLETASVPAETYLEGDVRPSEEDEAKEVNKQKGYHYALPTLDSERVGFCVAKDGLQYLAWVHGNLTAVPKDNNKFKAVGLRIAVSRNGGGLFEPLIPERVGYLVHAGSEA